ncbi:MAG: iron ABC transporter permease [Haloarculaceae archaeon]
MASSGDHSIRERSLQKRVAALVPAPLTTVAALVAVLLLSPLAWVLLRAAEVDVDRALALLLSADTVTIALNSLLLVGLVTLGGVLIGVPLAFLTVQTDLPFRRGFTILGALPLVVPSYIGAFAFVSAFGPRGELQGILAPLGIEEIPAIYGLPGTVVVLTLFTYPYVFLTTRAALLSVDGTAVEAARTLNHDRLGAFRHVTLPQIAPGIAAGGLLTALYTLSDFGTPMIMRYDVFTRMIFVEYNRNFNAGLASLLSLLLLAITVAILYWESRLGASREGAHVSSGSRRPGRVALGRWRWPAVGFCGLVAVLGVLLPLAILGMWLFLTAPGYAAGGFPFEWAQAINSLTLSGAAAVGAVVLGLPVAYLAARGKSRWAQLPERATYVGYAMPGVVLGLSLVFLGLKYVHVLYGTVVLLVFAYVVRFIPQAVGTMQSSILQVDPKHVDAARTMGDSSFVSFFRVELPQILPGVLSGAALVFLTTMKELPATLMLAPLDFEGTLVTYIWSVQEAGYYGQAALPALVLVGISGLSMLLILHQERYHGTE